MKNRIHLFVSRKNVLTWLMALCMVGSAVARIGIFCVKGTGDSSFVWSQIILPTAATLLYALIALLQGKEQFYKTAIPVWMMALYSAIWLNANIQSRMIVWLFWIALVFFAFLYTDITAGHRIHAVSLLLPVVASPIVFILYFYREAMASGDMACMHFWLPDLLALAGCLLQVFAIRIHPIGEYHPTWGDRVDGRRIRSLPPISQVSPYIMVNRNESSNLFADSFEISHVDRYIRQKRREGLTNFGITHVLLACYVRALCKYPALNRFLAGQKVYSRGEDVQYCMTVKKDMQVDSPDTVIKVHFTRTDTAEDVYRKLQAAVEEVKNTPLDSSFDNVAGAFTLIPGVLLKFAVWLLKTLDYFGMLPKFLLEVSPFHGSVFFTSMGSLGIPPIYHHLYDFGNVPVFCSFGKKRRAYELQRDGSAALRKYADWNLVTDERVVDGFYFASALRYIHALFQDPWQLDRPPEEVRRDQE